ncbi:Hint domain-containing protein [Alphaproteobacteria bacterium KMM 3653]|uniref:Hint domain-containing protein n=1 Tax=Harenicola maris TaxID=2841044 RepID=A0AAP2CMM6_9RHOB|nr:Hint domain-containing protein [Harenicola maris]
MAQIARNIIADQAIAPSQIFSQVGIAAGSVVLTAKGETLVEDIRPGDRVISRDRGMVHVTEVREIELSRPAIRVKAGALGEGIPGTDMVLGCDQPVLVRDWRAKAMFRKDRCVVPASALSDGEFVVTEENGTNKVYQIFCAEPHILYVNGVELGCGATLPEAV